jgi:hypothetical protein
MNNITVPASTPRYTVLAQAYFELPNGVAEINGSGGRKTATLPPYLGVLHSKANHAWCAVLTLPASTPSTVDLVLESWNA